MRSSRLRMMFCWLLFVDVVRRSHALVPGLQQDVPPLTCPEDGRWPAIYDQVAVASETLQHGDPDRARHLLGLAIDDATEDLHDAFRCPVGVAAAYRLLALAHVSDPASRLIDNSWTIALSLALRFQQLASGWLIYAYNVPANFDMSFVDGSRWPITSQEFDDEHRSVATALAAQRGGHLGKEERHHIHRSQRIPGLSLAIVSICEYPEGDTLPVLATSVHRLYASRHGYHYISHSKSSSGQRPPAWGKVQAMLDVLEDGRWDWILWVDCDLFFMDLETTIDSIMLRYGSRSDAQDESIGAQTIDPNLHMLVTEDSQMLNTAIFLMKRSDWSKDLLRRVWGPDDSPFINHTWWEQAAFAQELLGKNHVRFAGMYYGPSGISGLPVTGHPYPSEVSLVPQFEINSYHPISSRLVWDTWSPGKFVLSFNGAKSLSGPTVAKVLHANYYELFCQLNKIQELCEHQDNSQFSPWLLHS